MNESPPPGHLTDEKLAGFIDGTLSPSDRTAVEAHLADCAACRAEFVTASRVADEAPSPARRRVPLLTVGLIAAGLLIAVVGIRSIVPVEDSVRAGSASAADPGSVVSVVSPASDATVSPREIRFVWRPLETVLEYTITVQDADGRVRWLTSTSDTTVTMPDSVVITPGSVLHWYVDGLRADGRSIGTGRRQLTVR